MSASFLDFSRLFDMGLTSVKARQGSTFVETASLFASFLADRGVLADGGDPLAPETILAWKRPDHPRPHERFRLKVAESAVDYCNENGMINRWWADNLLASVDHPRRQSIVDSRFPVHQETTIPSSRPIDYFTPRSDDEVLKHMIRQAKEVWAWGSTFEGHVPWMRGLLERGLRQRDARYRFLMLEPDSCVVEMAAFRAGHSDPAQMNEALEANLDKLHALSALGSLEIRLVNYLSPYTMYVFDRREAHGHMLLHLSTFQGEDAWDRPTLAIARRESNEWFDYFTQQFESVWQVAKPLNVRR